MYFTKNKSRKFKCKIQVEKKLNNRQIKLIYKSKQFLTERNGQHGHNQQAQQSTRINYNQQTTKPDAITSPSIWVIWNSIGNKRKMNGIKKKNLLFF
jgi:hypothetical protein